MIITRIFLPSEITEIQEYVKKKLNVPDLYRLYDLCEGKIYLENSIYRVLCIKTILSSIDNINSNNYKVGLLNSQQLYKVLNFEKLPSLFDLKKVDLIEPSIVYSHRDFKKRECSIIISDHMKQLLLNRLVLFYELSKKSDIC